MSHSVKVTLIADQCIKLLEREVNIHDILSISMDDQGNIVAFVSTDETMSLIEAGVEVNTTTAAPK